MYTLITMYDDGFTKSEIVNELQTVFSTAAIYIQDKECSSIIAMNNKTKEFFIDFHRN